MKIRCTDCSKRIGIDDAFAGGVCRCPYCNALVFVPEERQPAEGAEGRAAPMIRPQTPDEMEAVAKARGQETIPIATPVKIQGIVTIVLIGVLALMVLGMAAVLIKSCKRHTRPPEEAVTQGEGATVNPFTMEKSQGSVVAGNVKLDSPIVYVLDGGGSMREVFNFAVAITRLSIRTLRESDQFTVLLCRDKGSGEEGTSRPAQGELFMPGGYLPGKGESESEVKKFLETVTPVGATDTPGALQAAMERKPKTIVLFARKLVDDALEVGAKAKEQGIRIVTVTMDSDESVQKSMAELAKAAGGQSRSYSFSSLQTFRGDSKVPPLD